MNIMHNIHTIRMAKSRRRNGKKRSLKKRGGIPKSITTATATKSNPSQLPVQQTTSFKHTIKRPWSNIIQNVTDNGKNIKFTLEDKREFSDHELDMKIIRAFQNFKWNAVELQDDILFTRDLPPANQFGEIYVYVVGPDPTLEWDGDDIVVNSRISKKHFLVKKNKINEFNAQCIYFFELPIKFSSRPLSVSNMQAVDG